MLKGKSALLASGALATGALLFAVPVHAQEEFPI